MSPPVVAQHEPEILWLDDERAAAPGLAGAKAANLATAATGGLPVLPGFVITTAAPAGVASAALRDAWERLSERGERLLVVRSSSTVEDLGTSSMAGQFTSVLDVDGWESFLAAADRVRASARGGPMAVLVQHQLDAELGGVLFGVDPVTGDRRHLVVEVVAERPDRLVSGLTAATRYVLTRRGRAVGGEPVGTAVLGRAQLRHLAAMARHAAALFVGPQDVEWAVDRDGRLWMLQARPVTAVADVAGDGPTLGPGPVAETFPHPLTRLEHDLWITPLAEGIATALRHAHAASPRRIETSPVVTTVGGRAAADLELLGWATATTPKTLLQRLNPVDPARRLPVAWRMGRLRSAMPAVAAQTVAAVDAELRAVPALQELGDAQLVALLARTRDVLVSVHGQEVLASALLRGAANDLTAAALALDALASADPSLDSEAVVRRAPVVLALVPPRVGAATDLERLPSTEPPAGAEPARRVADLGPREALRLRVRWCQELQARAAWLLGVRLAAAGRLDRPDDVRHLALDTLVAVVGGHGAAAAAPIVSGPEPIGPPLPARFRLSPAGEVIAVDAPASLGRTGAGGGRGAGPVVHRSEDEAPPAGSVLVTRTLDPDLAPLLPQLAGLVAETGSTLSHLAILAREMHVPTVVGADGALETFPVGSYVLVDGRTGEVCAVTPEEMAS